MSDQISTSTRNVTPSALGCEECLKLGSAWVHLRLCRTCGHVGCCDSSPNRHATKHFRKTRHPSAKATIRRKGEDGAMSMKLVVVAETRSDRRCLVKRSGFGVRRY